MVGTGGAPLRALRADIVTEFEANLRILESDLATNVTSQVRFAYLSELTDAELRALSSSELTSRFRGYLDWAGFDPEMGIVQALVESGNISVVSDRVLRLHLSRWAGLLEEKRRFNLQAVEFQNHVVTPAVARVSADLVWTDAERREIQSLFQGLSLLQRGVIENQRRLRDTGREIRSYVQAQE